MGLPGFEFRSCGDGRPDVIEARGGLREQGPVVGGVSVEDDHQFAVSSASSRRHPIRTVAMRPPHPFRRVSTVDLMVIRAGVMLQLDGAPLPESPYRCRGERMCRESFGSNQGGLTERLADETERRYSRSVA